MWKLSRGESDVVFCLNGAMYRAHEGEYGGCWESGICTWGEGVTAVEQRQIIHLNVANFYVAVANALTPSLRSRPVAVATAGSARRMVLDTSSEAHLSGVRRGMLLPQARRSCRDLVVLEPTPRLYDRAHRALLGEAARLSPRVEPAGPGHVFVDLTGTQRLLGDPVDCSARLQKEVLSKFSLDAAVGVATNKLMSKVATRVIKPTGLCRVVEGCESDFLAPLPVGLLPGVDPRVIQYIVQFNIRVIKDLLGVEERQLCSVFGPQGHDVYRSARGEDDSPVREIGAPAPTVTKGHVFEGQTNDDATVERALFRLVTRAGHELRHMGMSATRIHLSLSYSDGSRSRRSARLLEPLNGDLSLFSRFSELLTRQYSRRIRLSDMEIALSELTYPYGDGGYQMDLFDDTELRKSKEAGLMAAMDKLRDAFGGDVVDFGKVKKQCGI